jgi:hypothetical protein
MRYGGILRFEYCIAYLQSRHCAQQIPPIVGMTTFFSDGICFLLTISPMTLTNVIQSERSGAKDLLNRIVYPIADYRNILVNKAG